MKPTKHRNLYNGDCTFLFGQGYLTEENAPFSVEVLERFADRLVEGGVDTYLQNPNAQKPWYPSKAVASVLDGYTRDDKEFIRGHYPPANDTDLSPEFLDQVLERDAKFLNRYLDLLDSGVDWIAEMAKICRARDISPWLSIRMNDLHGANSWEKSYMNSEWQGQEKYRLSGRKINPNQGVEPFEQACNYEHPEVRDFYFAMIRELVCDYDYEGIELDWNRSAFCCEAPASQKTIDTMTQWIGDIRKLTNEQAEKNGKPYPLGLCIPGRVRMLREIGLDIKALAREGLIDFISPANFWQTAWEIPYDEIRAIVGDEVAIYGMIDDAPNWMHAQLKNSDEESYRLLSASPQLLRGNAAGKLAMGCDGIETFNFFCTDEIGIHPSAEKRLAEYSALQNIDDLESLRGQPKQYALASMNGYYMFPLWETAEQVPALVEPQARRAFRLSMCAEPDSTSEMTIQIVLEKPAESPQIGVSFNDSWPNFEAKKTRDLLFPNRHSTHHNEQHVAFDFRCSVERIKEGWNEIRLFNTGEETVRVVSVEIAIA